MEGKKGFQIWVNPDYYHLKKAVVIKGSGRSRRKKGLKSIPQQARDWANLRGLDKEVPHGSRQRFKAKTLKDLDHSDGDDEDNTYEDTSKLKLPSKRALTVHKAPGLHQSGQQHRSHPQTRRGTYLGSRDGN